MHFCTVDQSLVFENIAENVMDSTDGSCNCDVTVSMLEIQILLDQRFTQEGNILLTSTEMLTDCGLG